MVSGFFRRQGGDLQGVDSPCQERGGGCIYHAMPLDGTDAGKLRRHDVNGEMRAIAGASMARMVGTVITQVQPLRVQGEREALAQ